MPHNNNHCYEFGSFRLDPTKRVLSRAGETISLTPKATDILLLLVMNAGELVEKDELLKEVWPDTFIEEANLSQNIFTLRRALGDERSDRRFIETVARRGYRFIAKVSITEVNEQPVGVAAKEVSPHPVVAVLPFLNTTGDPEREYLAEGITDNIINNLSRVSKLRVMSRSAISRYRTNEVDPQQAGKELGANAVLIGNINSRPNGVGIDVELIDARTNWQLWGESFDCENQDILEIQETITRRLLMTMRLSLTGQEEKNVTARYTENARAYEAYLEGRYHWSRYTKNGIEKAIGHFRYAIDLDPNYALAYAGIVDCYLRLATNYLPPEEDAPKSASEPGFLSKWTAESDPRVKLRFEWDWKAAERELRRANELRVSYVAAHQWYAAYSLAQQLLERSQISNTSNQTPPASRRDVFNRELPTQFASLELTPSEQVQVYCAIAREQIDIGNYDAASMILQSWWQFGSWPKVEGLNQQSCADLLFTTGELAGCVASTRQVPKGQKHGEVLLSGSIALFEQLGSRIRAAEGRIELALCYYRQGLFDLGRSTLLTVLDQLSAQDEDLRSLALIRLASIERHAGRLPDALSRLNEAAEIAESSGPWATGRCNLELASTYKDISVSQEVQDYFDDARKFYLRALSEFQAVGNHRLAAIAENNLGYLLLIIEQYSDAESHLLRARRSFDCLKDKIRCAQSDDSLARLRLAQGEFALAERIIDGAVKIMEGGDEDALLAEVLTTKGMICCKVNRLGEARRALEEAHRLASRCGDHEGAGRALLVLIEEMCEVLGVEERDDIGAKLVKLLSSSQQPSIHRRLRRGLEILASADFHSE